MKELTICFSVLVTGLLILTLGPLSTEAIFNNICRLFADGVELRDPYACDAYVTCIDSVEVSSKCPKGQQFSVEKKKCLAGTDNCDDPCAPDNNNIWAADPKSCTGYYHCSQGIGNFGVCPYDLHFHEDEQQCVYEWQSQCNSTMHNNNYCHFVPDGINFADEDYCDKYRVCEKRVLKIKSCSSGQMYNRKIGKCGNAATVGSNCRAIPNNICTSGLLNSPVRGKFVADPATCRGYYYCEDKGKDVADDSPAWGQCPEGLFFSGQSCVNPLDAVCKLDRCDGRGDMFVNSHKNCQYYLTCKNGVQESERQCSDYRFFDEKRQACTTEVIEYKACCCN